MRSARLQRVFALSSMLFAVLFASALLASSTTFAQAADGSSRNHTQAQVQEEWVARYNDPVNSNEMVSALAVDNQGNVYVTGGTGFFGPPPPPYFDYAIIKYSPDGKSLWTQRYSGPGNGHDIPTALAVDNQGNVYVTGNTATLKYNTNGTLLWEKLNNDGSGYSFGAVALALDNRGNVYVTGSGPSVGTAESRDYITLKYDTNGTLLWVQRYNGPSNIDDHATALAVDNQGNVYVTGDSVGDGTGSDYATLKYDRNGTLLWVQRYNGPSNIDDHATALAVDNQGNVYVTGSSMSGTVGDYATLKYDRKGILLWAQRYNDNSVSSFDGATALAVDNQGNVYVTGRMSRSAGGGWYYIPTTVVV